MILLCDNEKTRDIKNLYDNFKIDRENILKLFEKVGVKIVEEQIWKKIDKEAKGVLVKINL